MAKDNSSNKYSKENYNLLNGMKRYLGIEHKDDDKDLLDYLRKQAGLHRYLESCIWEHVDIEWDLSIEIKISVSYRTETRSSPNAIGTCATTTANVVLEQTL
jgi:hypothetical protein